MTRLLTFITSPAGGELTIAISLSAWLSIRSRISKTARPSFTTFPNFSVHVLFWRQCDTLCTSGFVDNGSHRYEHIYSPIRQTQTEKYRYIQRGTILDITKHIVIELAQQIRPTNSFMQWNKNSSHALITVKNHKWPEYIMQKAWLRYKRL